MIIVFSDLSKQGLASIEEYTRQKWGNYQADIYLAQIENRILGLLETPYLGTARNDVSNGYRCLPEGKHLIFYRVDNDVIYILGAPHASMDLDKHLQREQDQSRL